MQHEFLVPDMTCGHCVSTITQAVHEVAPEATIEADTKTHWLSVKNTDLDAQTLLMKIQAAGYSPKRV